MRDAPLSWGTGPRPVIAVASRDVIWRSSDRITLRSVARQWMFTCTRGSIAAESGPIPGIDRSRFALATNPSVCATRYWRGANAFCWDGCCKVGYFVQLLAMHIRDGETRGLGLGPPFGPFAKENFLHEHFSREFAYPAEIDTRKSAFQSVSSSVPDVAAKYGNLG